MWCLLLLCSCTKHCPRLCGNHDSAEEGAKWAWNKYHRRQWYLLGEWLNGDVIETRWRTLLKYLYSPPGSNLRERSAQGRGRVPGWKAQEGRCHTSGEFHLIRLLFLSCLCFRGSISPIFCLCYCWELVFRSGYASGRSTASTASHFS